MAGFNLHNYPVLNHGKYKYDGLEFRIIDDSDKVQLSVQTPKNYPIFQSEDKKIICEGYLYNSDCLSTGQMLLALLESGREREIPSLIESIDGEFVFILRLESGELYIINDRWSHLPVYVYEHGNDLIISRNISFITNGVEVTFDRISAALMLLLGTNLGSTTLWAEIRRLAPNSILKFDPNTGLIVEQSYFKLTHFEGTASIIEIKDALFEAVNVSAKNRLNRLPNPSLSLSGGLDSRLAVASICSVSAPVPLITHDRQSGIDKPDCLAAKEICRRLNVSEHHEIVALGVDQLEDSLELLRIKQGLNCVSMGHVLPFHKLFRDRNLSCISDYGGGGKFFRKIYPNCELKSTEGLVRYILRFHSTASVETIAKICRVDAKHILDTITSLLNGYPHKSFNDKYAYFIFREVLINWAFEADRQRNYSWVSVPFYDPKVIDLCFSVPQQSKEQGELFKALFSLYPGNLETIENPNWKLTLTDKKGLTRLFKRQALKAKLPIWLIHSRKVRPFEEFTFQHELLEELHQNQFFDQKEFRKKGTQSYYWQLFTLLMLTNGRALD